MIPNTVTFDTDEWRHGTKLRKMSHAISTIMNEAYALRVSANREKVIAIINSEFISYDMHYFADLTKILWPEDWTDAAANNELETIRNLAIQSGGDKCPKFDELQHFLVNHCFPTYDESFLDAVDYLISHRRERLDLFIGKLQARKIFLFGMAIKDAAFFPILDHDECDICFEVSHWECAGVNSCKTSQA